MEKSIGMIATDLANSINTVSSTIQLLERDLKKPIKNTPLDLVGKAITALKNQCGQTQIQLENCVDSLINHFAEEKKGPH